MIDGHGLLRHVHSPRTIACPKGDIFIKAFIFSCGSCRAGKYMFKFLLHYKYEDDSIRHAMISEGAGFRMNIFKLDHPPLRTSTNALAYYHHINADGIGLASHVLLLHHPWWRLHDMCAVCLPSMHVTFLASQSNPVSSKQELIAYPLRWPTQALQTEPIAQARANRWGNLQGS